jgi:hypothetical protein
LKITFLPAYHPDISARISIIQSYFTQAVGKSQQKELPEREYPGIFNIVIIAAPVYPDILIQDIPGAQFKFSPVEFKDLPADGCVP